MKTFNKTNLREYGINSENALFKFVVDYLLKQSRAYAIKTHIHDIQSYGTSGGNISFLIYYKDTHAFFERFYNEIEEIRTDFEHHCGQSITIKGDLKDFLARFAFEWVISEIASYFDL